MERTALSYKIDQASRDYWKTKNPKFKKEWYKLISRFAQIIRRKPKRKLKNKSKRLKEKK
jgi:hypothetical protein|tara:strand:- start:350 stop:529 length:180 start_codon:yes stop_codon:yes gene_type:complete